MTEASVRCAACDHAFVAPVPASLVLPRDRAAEQALLEDTLLTALCPSCGTVNDVEPRTLLFTDLVRRWYVVMLPAARVAEAERLERVVDDAFQREFQQDREVWDQPGLVRRRVVFGREALREKVLLWSLGLDDGVVEALKAAMIDTAMARELGLARMRVRAVDQKNLWFRVEGKEDRLDVDLAAYLTMEKLRPQLEDRWPALFRPGWVDAARIA
jgi:hypothetical protein